VVGFTSVCDAFSQTEETELEVVANTGAVSAGELDSGGSEEETTARGRDVVFCAPAVASGLANENGATIVELVVDAAAGVADSVDANDEFRGPGESTGKLLEKETAEDRIVGG
jgi:hypothetical protein